MAESAPRIDGQSNVVARLTEPPSRTELAVMGAIALLALSGVLTGVLGTAWLFGAPAALAVGYVAYHALRSTPARRRGSGAADEAERQQTIAVEPGKLSEGHADTL